MSYEPTSFETYVDRFMTSSHMANALVMLASWSGLGNDRRWCLSEGFCTLQKIVHRSQSGRHMVCQDPSNTKELPSDAIS